MKAVEILERLVAMPTASSESNLPLIRWVAERLSAAGWASRVFEYSDERGVAKANLVARPAGCGDLDHLDRMELGFICHTDTVPARQEWTDAHRLIERDGDLLGLGACDVKGALACFLAAAVAGVDRGVGLILTAEEEIGCKGMEELLKALPELRMKAALVSEPTSLRAGVAGKGYGLARVTVEGREAHSAFPQQGVSAIYAAARLIAGLEWELAQDASVSEDLLFDPPWTTWNIGTIAGGSAKNIIPGECSFLVEWRALPGERAGAVAERLKGVVADFGQRTPEVTVAVEVLRDEAGFGRVELDGRGVLEARLAELLDGTPVGISFGSEASRVAGIADEVMVVGPGDMRTAHSDRERVPMEELEKWTAVLGELLRGVS